jgi:hypothetical protein
MTESNADAAAPPIGPPVTAAGSKGALQVVTSTVRPARVRLTCGNGTPPAGDAASSGT